jgi:hypothetical protein
MGYVAVYSKGGGEKRKEGEKNLSYFWKQLEDNMVP